MMIFVDVPDRLVVTYYVAREVPLGTQDVCQKLMVCASRDTIYTAGRMQGFVGGY